MFLGFLIRIKTYLVDRPLWHDECSLALNIMKRSFTSYFGRLEHHQAAPFLFMCISKIFSILFGIKEFSLRAFPFLCGIFSIPVFYYFSKMFLKKKFSILVVTYLFSINYYLIYYSQEFKHYSVDVFVFLLLFIFLSKLDLSNIDYKKNLFFAFLLAFMPLLSFVSLFVIAAYCLSELITKKFGILKRLVIFIVPLVIIFLIYYFVALLPQKFDVSTIVEDYWEKGFLELNFNKILYMFKLNLSYYLYPNKFLLVQLILIVIGFLKLLNQPKSFPKVLFFSCIFLILIASFLHLYPISERASLYIIPIMLILLVYPLEFAVLDKKFYAIVISILTILSFCSYNYRYVKNFFSDGIFQRMDARSSMKILSEKYLPNDYVIINPASDSEYFYYSNYYNFATEKWGIVNLPEYNEGLYYKILEMLPHGKYWFYFAYDYSHSPVIPFLKKWKEHKKVLFESVNRGSYLLYLEI